MAAYVIAEVDVIDPATYEEYKRLAEASIAAAGGRYLARGGQSALLEGAGDPQRIVLLEFPDRATAQAWWDGPGYGAARAVRTGAAVGRFLLVEGVAQ